MRHFFCVKSYYFCGTENKKHGNMKRILCLIALPLVLLSSENIAAKVIGWGTKIQIALMATDKDKPRDLTESDTTSPENTPKTRSLFQPVTAYLSMDVVTVVFDVPIPDVKIAIINEVNGEIVREEDAFSPSCVDIELTGVEKGNYRIVIEAGDIVWEGFFSL